MPRHDDRTPCDRTSRHGLGKTTFLSRQVQIAAHKLGRSSVLVASLTKAAATEVAGRDTGIDARRISTLHGHAFRALERPKKIAEAGEGPAAWNSWIASKAPRLKVDDRYSLDPENAPLEGPTISTDGDRMVAEVGILRARMTPQELWPRRAREFYGRWQEWKAGSGYVDFTDLIENAIAEVDVAPGEPQVIFLDEAQDMSRLEMTLARKWGAAADQLVIVGDPYQNLYEWRGSEPEAFYAGPAATERVLSQSYRVPRAVHAYATAWAQSLVPEGGSFPSYLPRDHEGEVRNCDARWNTPDALLRLIAADLEAYEDSPDHPTVMVLATCGFMLNPLIRTLKAYGIPFANPYRLDDRQGWNPMRGAGRLLSFLRPDDQTFGDDARMWTWKDLHSWVDFMTADGYLVRGAKAKIERRAKAEVRFADMQPGDELVTVDDVQELFLAEHWDALFDVDPEWWLGSLRGKRARQFDYPSAVLRQRGRSELARRPRVCLGTIHSVKGGQADSVYVFPDLSRQGFWRGWSMPDARPAVIRQFYVAFTRSRDKLTLCANVSVECAPLPRARQTAAGGIDVG